MKCRRCLHGTTKPCLGKKLTSTSGAVTFVQGSCRPIYVLTAIVLSVAAWGYLGSIALC